jgi:sulfate adenylyltransferase subunit 1
MATGASNADALVLLIDATKKLLPQTRRHLLIARLLGIRQVVAFVNKMDLIGYSQAAFQAIKADFEAFAAPLAFDSLDVLPGSALRGDMVVDRGALLDWYSGPTLMERLESLASGAEKAAAGPLRFPVQLVSRPTGGAPRGYMGRLESGHLLAGAEVLVLPSGRRSRVRQLLAHGSEREIAVAGDSITVVLTDDIDLSRGDLIVDPARPPIESRSLDVTLVWLGEEPLRADGRYLVQQAARRALGKVSGVSARLDISTLKEIEVVGPVVANDIVRAKLTLQAPLFVDPYETVRTTGALILIDEATNATVAAGLVR